MAKLHGPMQMVPFLQPLSLQHGHVDVLLPKSSARAAATQPAAAMHPLTPLRQPLLLLLLRLCESVLS